MDYTQNLHLPQWEASDRIMHGDFNDAFAAIDAAVAEKADATTVAALQSAVAGIVTGKYTGNGTSSRTIYVGFRPKAVFLCRNNGESADTIPGDNVVRHCGGLCIDGTPIVTTRADKVMEIVDSGFTIYHDGTVSVIGGKDLFTNQSGWTYCYVAIK